MAESGIDDKIELHLIDTRQLVEEAKKIREAKKLATDAAAAKKDLAAGVSPLGQPAQQNFGAPIGNQKNKPKSFFESEQQTRKSAIGGARTQTAFTQQQLKQKELEKQIADQAKKQADLEKQQKKLQDEIEKAKKEADKKREEFESKAWGTANVGIQSILNPASIPSTILSKIGRLGTVGAIIAFAAGEIISELQKQFDRGGIFSTKLKVPRQALTLNDIDVSNSWRDGTKYITSDLRIVQKAPQSSNTLKISHEAIRYVMDDLGRSH